MNILLYIPLFFTLLLSEEKKENNFGGSICKVYGSIYVETQNRNRADIVVYVDNDHSFPELKVFIQENQFYADKPGMWYFTKDRNLADFVIYLEKEEGHTRNVISYTDFESEAGCQ